MSSSRIPKKTRVISNIKVREMLVGRAYDTEDGELVQYANCSWCQKEIGLVEKNDGGRLYEKFSHHICEPRAHETLLLIESVLSEDEAPDYVSLDEKLKNIQTLIQIHYENEKKEKVKAHMKREFNVGDRVEIVEIGHELEGHVGELYQISNGCYFFECIVGRAQFYDTECFNHYEEAG